MHRILLSIALFFICLHSFSQWTPTNGPEGGYTDEIVQVGNDLFVSASTGGVYKSSDGGSTWNASNSGMPVNKNVQVLVENNNTLYASIYQNGIYKSEDGGNNWVAINSGVGLSTFYAMKVDGMSIYAGNANGGITYSHDGGQNWTYKGDNVADIQFQDFEFFNSKIYATGGAFSSSSSGFYESSDEGLSWQELAVDGVGPNGFRTLLADDGIFYAGGQSELFISNDNLNTWVKSPLNSFSTIISIRSYFGNIYVNAGSGSFYFSDDNGLSWTQVQNSDSDAFVQDIYVSEDQIIMSTNRGLFKSVDTDSPWYPVNMGIIAQNISTIYSNVNSVYAGVNGQGIFRSTNEGLSWDLANNGLNDNSSKYINEIVEVNNTIYLATDSGIYASLNNGDTWVRKLDPGLNQSNKDIAYDNGIFVTASSGSSIYMSTDMTQTWSQLTIDVLIEPSYFREIEIKGDTIAVSTYSDIYTSKNLGVTWQKSTSIGSSSIRSIEMLDDKMYVANYNAIYVSNDLGESWEVLNDSFRPNNISDLVISDDVIYAASEGGVYVTAANRNEWYSISDGLNGSGVGSLTIGDNYVYGGITGASVWKLPKTEATLPPPIEYPFVTRWYTGNPGTSNNNQITIPTYPGETYNYNVDWGDGTTSEGVTGDITHTYTDVDSYNVSITGVFPRIYFNNSGDIEKINGVSAWGTTQWTSMEKAFYGCSYLGISASDEPDFSRLESTESMFENCRNLNTQYYSINQWDMSAVKNMKRMFYGTERFIGDISSWNVGNVENMESMFENTLVFNNDISTWNVGQVINMKNMFKGAIVFNTDIGNWNVSNVTDMIGMFKSAVEFDQSLAEWNVAKVQSMNKFLSGTSISKENYDTLLKSWSGLPNLQNGVIFGAGISNYCTAEIERQSLINNYGWTINDAGLSCIDDVSSFVTVWKTDNNGDSEDNQITVPTTLEEAYNYTIHWGDGTSDEGVMADITHTYDSPGIYQVSISGDFPRIVFNASGDSEKILQIKQWGDIQWTSMENAFYGCRNLDMKAVDSPNLTNVTSLERMFRNCYLLEGNESFSNWSTGSIQNMSELFSSVHRFNVDISSWDVSQVTNMSGMFIATALDYPIGNWNVSNVTDMSQMFLVASFNQDISNWDVSKVTNTSYMFANSFRFNQDIGVWNMENVLDMSGMFSASYDFNQDISNWDFGNVRNMSEMFKGARAFNQDISSWNTSNVENMASMFERATVFDQSLADLDIGNVTNMTRMFNDIALTQQNYDATLIGWTSQANLKSDVVFDGGNSRYCSGTDARQTLITDYGWVITDKGEKCPTPTNAIWLEAECATVGANWSLIASTDASEGQYLLAPQGNNMNAPTDENAIVAFNFEAEAGVYKVFARVSVPSQDDDSFWVRANGGEWQVWDLIPGNSEFSWQQIHDGVQNTVFKSFDLKDGQNTLEFGHREDGAGIDKVFVTKTNEVPDGFGTSSSNCPQNPFVTTWQTDINYEYESRITIPTFGGGYDYTVDWGDGSADEGVTSDISHNYQTPGTYQVSITGDFPRIHFNYGHDHEKIISIDAWGDIEWLTMKDAFQGCENLQLKAQDVPDLSLVTSLSSMFSSCENLIGNESLNNWNVGNVTEFQYMFSWAKKFNADISNWNVSKGILFYWMFSSANSFNQDIGEWNLINAQNISGMFDKASMFNQDISTWHVDRTTDLSYLFNDATSFNQDISSWNVSGVQYMNRTFNGATAFDQDLGGWNVSNASGMDEMFKDVTLSLENYDSILTSWAALVNLNSGVNFDGGNSQYCLGTDARQILVNNKGWTITDGGENCTSIRLVVDAGDDQSITLPATTSANFNGTASSPDGEIVSYSWVFVSGPNTPMLTGQDKADLAATGFAVGTYTFILTVVDDQGQSDFDQVTLQVLSGGTSVPIVDAGQDQNTTETSITINGSGSDPDGGDVTYLWSQESGPNMADLANQNTTALTVSNLIDGAYVFRLSITDDENDTTFDEVMVTITTPEVFALRINTGGTEVDYNEETFVSDTYFNTGSTLDRPQTGLPEPYQTFRFSRSQEMSYNIPLEDGEYTVNLYFAELWFGATGGGSGGVGSRVFDVSIEGDLAEDNLDVFAEVGADAMLLRSHIVTVTGGILNIDFDSRDAVGGERHPIINAIEILGEVMVPVERPFVTTWKTDNPGISENNQITIPTYPGETYNYIVEWGDGTSDSGMTGDITHTYATAGTYQVSISGEFPRIYFDELVNDLFSEKDADKIVSIDQWGNNSWSSMDSAFVGCDNLDVLAMDSPNLSSVTSISNIFERCSSLVGTISFDDWDVSNITDMSWAFFGASSFNISIGDWDVSQVTNMMEMFNGATLFNQDLSNWNVSNVTDMGGLFNSANAFNQDLSSWNVAAVTNMSGMFSSASSFDQPIGNWDVSQVTNMGSMFGFATLFNQDLSNWNVSNVTNMRGMFSQAEAFNMPIGNWDVQKVTDMSSMFSNTPLFNQDIGNWDVSSVVLMNFMFSGASSFNQDIVNWDVDNVTSMEYMFPDAIAFNQPIGTWNVSNVKYMDFMFGSATAFDQPLGNWAISSVTNMEGMFFNSGLSLENYDDTLNGWSSQALVPSGLNFDAGNSQYCQGEEARQKLIDDFGWTITDGGKAEDCVDTTSFITTWKTDNSGTSEDNQITIPTFEGETYNYTVHWGDGTSDSGVTGNITHTYATAGTYDVSISGEFPRIYFNASLPEYTNDNNKIISINQWGDIKWTDMQYAFSGCSNLEVVATDIPELTYVQNMIGMFNYCISLEGNTLFNDWDVSNVTDMRQLFEGATSFNQPLNNWDVSNVGSMFTMFSGASSFNQDISNWDVSNAYEMTGMFTGASSFNQNIGNWNVGKVDEMSDMFDGAISFDQDLGSWNISNVTGMADFLKGVALSLENYDNTLIGWNAQQLQSGVTFDGGNSKYCQGEEARQKLIDDFGWIITDAGKVADCPEPSDFALRINTGGAEVEYNDETFIADTYFNTGNVLDRPQTGLQEPYQTFRFSRSQEMSYDIPLEDGEYTVNLYFAELWFGATGGGSGGVGSRVFDVTIEGQLAEDNLDVFAEVGADAMLMRSHMVTVTGGILDIDFDSRDAVGGERHPIINAIEILGQTSEPEERPFVTTWKTDNIGGSNDNQITFPGFSDEETYTIVWGDGTSDTAVIEEITHTYEVPGIYTISVQGGLNRFSFGQFGDFEKLLTIENWGTSNWSVLSFSQCANLDIPAIDIPDLSNVNDMIGMFSGCTSLIGTPSFNDWDTSNITSMQATFQQATLFNQPIGNWNLNNVNDISFMFAYAESFNQDIGNWNLSKVFSMWGTFIEAYSFNQPIGDWNVSEVVDMTGTFFGADSFNQDISDWDVSKLDYLYNLFDSASAFNQNLGNWNLSSATQLQSMFDDSGLSTENYDATLIGWSTNASLQVGVPFGAEGISYCQGEEARQKLIDDFGWTITDAGKAEDCPDTTSFITTWKTDNPGISEDNQITIPTFEGETYNYTVEWGDGTSDSGVTGDITHTYSAIGTYQVSISGQFPRIYFAGGFSGDGDSQKILSVDQWGELRWESMKSAFEGCTNLDILATDIPDFSKVYEMSSMFRFCTNLIVNETISEWDVSNVVNMIFVFGNASSFNQDLSNWDISNVVNFIGMFNNASSFNQNISTWDLSNASTIGSMFKGASSFNQDIGNWNISNITAFGAVFSGASSFNQDISNWDVSNVTYFEGAFSGASSFNQDISNWDVSSATNMSSMFSGADSFNQDISNWDVSNVTAMNTMFGRTSAFNQDLSSWDVSNVTDMAGLFIEAKSFNQDLSDWDVSNVTTMELMFKDADAYNQNLGEWDITNVVNMVNMFKQSNISTQNYDTSLIGWSTQQLQNGVIFDGGNSKYCLGEEARQKLIDDFGWIITDAGKAEDCADTTSFITTWKTDNPGRNENEIMIGTFPGEVYNFTVDWGDGSSDSGITEAIIHTYETPGTYTVSVSGQFPRVILNSVFYNERLIAVNQWGSTAWSSMELAFDGCINLDVLATDLPDLSNTTSLANMFSNCTNLMGTNEFAQWDVSNITDMSTMFYGTGFNQPIGPWDVSKVTDMNNMFGESPFNQNIGNWDVSKVSNMEAIFSYATEFNQDISNWNVSNVESMATMFQSAGSFNQPIGSWNVSKVTNMNGMFAFAEIFDQNIGTWNVSEVEGMNAMFYGTTSMSQENYDKMLIGWNSLPLLQNNVEFYIASEYCAGAAARQTIVEMYGWNIQDSGLALDCPEPNDFALRINTGGTETDYNGETFIADTYFNTGLTLDRPQTGLPEPFQTFRFSRSQEMSYDILLEDGEYTVNLYFAELWFGATGGGAGGLGSRVFDVNIEGNLSEDNLDIFAEVGADAMLMKSYTVTVTGGVLDIDFDSRAIVGGQRHPVINAIEILGSSNGATSPVTSISATNVTSTSFIVDWTLSSAHTGQVQWGTTSALGNETILESNFLNQHIQPVAGLEPTTTYYYRVIGEDATGVSFAGDIRSVKTLTAGSGKRSFVNTSVLSPNPVVTSTTLSFEKPVELTTIQVFDVTGRLVHTYEAANVSDNGAYLLNVNRLPTGTYYLKSHDIEGQQYQKQMVIKK